MKKIERLEKKIRIIMPDSKIKVVQCSITVTIIIIIIMT